MNLIIDGRGNTHAIYSEAINLACLGTLAIRRASHVEPDDHGSWWADLSPVDGPALGPFDRRSDALDAEVRWLDEHWLSGAFGEANHATCINQTEERSWD